MSYEIEAMLEKAGLTEFKPDQWCQNGAQAGWGPDLDGNLPCIEVKASTVSGSKGVVRIYNDIYSERVQGIEKAALALGYEVDLSFKPE